MTGWEGAGSRTSQKPEDLPKPSTHTSLVGWGLCARIERRELSSGSGKPWGFFLPKPNPIQRTHSLVSLGPSHSEPKAPILSPAGSGTRSFGTFPRLVVAGTHSGVGKTTVSLGMMGALAKRGLSVQPFKAGPDFIDPTHHTVITGRPSRNLDSWLMNHDVLVELFIRAAAGADLCIIEGVMGLYDGASGTDERGSAAHLSKLLHAPVLLVIDASAMARSAAAVVMGFQKLDPQVHIAGVILNQVRSPRHRRYLTDALLELTSTRVVGAIPRHEAIKIPSRHLGLFSGYESPKVRKAHEQIVSMIEDALDLEAVLDIAHAAEDLTNGRPQCFLATSIPNAVTTNVAYAWDETFYFYYRDNLELLEHLGCRLVPFSPLKDTCLPPADLVYFGGGYPELFASELSANRAMLRAIEDYARGGGVIYAECGGLMYLSEGITTSNGDFFPLVGLFPARATMTQKKLSLGYVDVTFEQDCLLGPRGESIRGHEFHYSQLKATGSLSYAYRLSKGAEGPVRTDGIKIHNVLAAYSHLHFASNPRVAPHLVSVLRARAGAERPLQVAR